MSHVPRFDLLVPLGRGGMGEVWSAVAGDGTRVAVKLLTATGALRPRAVAMFAEEVRAVARLDHRAIVHVFDCGVVDRTMAASAGGRVVEGTPWLAMEIASGGTLQSRPVLDWPCLRALLAFLLEGVAHAHARGVLHRDLKPENILVGSEQDPRPGPKIADFGIAGVVSGDSRRGSGTPGFMAPEQRRGGPEGTWTDLYAFGVLAWHLAGTRSSVPTGLGPSPRFRPRIAVPSGLVGWLERLVQVEPSERFGSAADAAWSLLQITGDLLVPDPADLGGDAPREVTIDFDGDTDEVPIVPRAAPIAVDHVPPSWSAWRDLTPGGAMPGMTALPDPPRHPIDIVGAGTGLFGSRVVPFVARRREREQLWEELGAACLGARGVLIRGVAGIGRSRLLAWIAETAEEVGLARAFVVACEPADGPTDAVARLVAAMRKRSCGVADEDDRLLALVEGRAGAFDRATERYALVGDLVRRLAVDRPVLLGLDDVHQGPDVLGLAEHLLAADLPVLVVATTRDPEARPGWRDVEIGPLSDDESRSLVEQILGLDAVLAAVVGQRAGGHPGAAVRMVADWVARGLLVPTPLGLGLAPRVDPWAGAGWDEQAIHGAALLALERAAAGGTSVDEDEWIAAADVDGLDVTAGRQALADLALRRLVVLRRGGFSFGDGPARDALEARARREGRWAAHHRAWATTLGDRVDPTRRGLHLIEAGDLDAGIPLVIRPMGERDDRPPEAVIVLTARCERALVAAGRADVLLAAVLAARASPLRALGQNHAALVCAERALALGPGAVVEADCRFRAALCQIDANDIGAARAHGEALLALATRDAAGAPVEARGALVMSRIARRMGDYAAELPWIRRASEAFALAGEEEWVARLRCQIGMTLAASGDPGGVGLVREALEISERLGSHALMADAWSGLAELARVAGDADAALVHHARSARHYTLAGRLAWTALQELGRARIEITRGRPEAAREPLEAARAYFERRPWPWTDAFMRLAVCAIAAFDRDWPAWDRQLALAADRGLDDTDIEMLELAAGYAERAGDPARAEVARRLGRER